MHVHLLLETVQQDYGPSNQRNKLKTYTHSRVKHRFLAGNKASKVASESFQL